MVKKITWIILLTLLIFLRYKQSLPKYKVGDRVRISSTVTSEPVQYSDTQAVKLMGLTVYLPLYPRVYYGDKLVVEGKVELTKKGNKVLNNPEIIDYIESKGILPALRKKLVSFYKSALPEPHSSLVAGVTIGSKAAIPEGFWEGLKNTGTAHVVVASGMNVTLVASFLLNLFVNFVSRKKAVVISLTGIWVYAFLSGFDAPIVRAAVMGSIGFSAVGLGRAYDAYRGLFISAFLMLLVKPLWLTDLGFILSFVATASLMLFEAKVDKKIQFVPHIFREGLSTSLAAQIGVAPILYFTFGQFNPLSFVINALVLWTIGPITMISMVIGLVGIAITPLGRLLILIVYPLTLYFVKVIEIFSS